MKRFLNRLVEAFDSTPIRSYIYQKILTTGRAIFTDVAHSECSLKNHYAHYDLIKINCCLNVPFIY